MNCAIVAGECVAGSDESTMPAVSCDGPTEDWPKWRTYMPATSTSWQEIPPVRLIALLGDDGDRMHPRDICRPDRLAERFGIPLELLPVSEILADTARGIVLYGDDRKAVGAMQGVVAGDLIDAIAKGLGIAWPRDCRKGYSGSRIDLAAAIVRHLRSS